MKSGFAKTDDGVHLYYNSLGHGPLTFVCCNGVGVSTFFFKYIRAHFGKKYRILTWDYRGHGRSSSPDLLDETDLSIERSTADLRTVLNESNVMGPIVLMGHSMGVQVILEYYSRYPQNIVAIVPMFGTFGRPLDTFLNFSGSKSAFKMLAKLADASGKTGNLLVHSFTEGPLAFALGRRMGMMSKKFASRPDMAQYFEHMNRLDQRLFLRMVSQIADHDAASVLPTISVPTLVFAGERDLFTPLHRSMVMTDSVPGAEIFVLAQGSHAAIIEHPEEINERIEQFISEKISCEQSQADQ